MGYDVISRGARERRLTTLAAVVFAMAPLACAQPAYNISTIAGNYTRGFSGDGAAATSAELAGPQALAVDSSGNLYIVDEINSRIRKVTSGGTISTVAGNGTQGYAGDGAAASSAELNAPYAIKVDSAGNLYIADLGNFVVRKVTGTTISTIAGNSQGGYSGDGGPATAAMLNHPSGVALDSAGNLYIAEQLNHRIRKVDASGNITTVAGNGLAGYSGDGGLGIKAQLNAPLGIATDKAGNLYIADSANNVIRMLAPNGIITTIAGNGNGGYSGDNAAATAAKLFRPFDVATDSAGNVYIADYNNQRIREVTVNGVITTIAGGIGAGYTGDGGPATSAALNFPTGVAVDSGGNVYIADSNNNVIRKLTPLAAQPATPVITAVSNASSFGGGSAIAPGSWIEVYGTNLAATMRSWTGADFSGVNAPTSLDGTTITIGGLPAYVDFVSGFQVNVQVPSGVPSGTQPMKISTQAGGTSQAFNVAVNSVQPGLLGPPSFIIGGRQYMAAIFPDGSFVLPPGTFADVNSHRPLPGDTIELFGVGFGPVTPGINAGVVTQQSNTITGGLSSLQVFFNGTPGTVTYAGLAPGSVGLYQINVVVPTISASDQVKLTFTLNGVPSTQSLYTIVL